MIRLLLFAVVFYYLFKFIARIFSVFLIKKAQQQHTNQSGNFNQQHYQKKDGDIKITYTPNSNKKHVKGGDYVEFEELE